MLSTSWTPCQALELFPSHLATWTSLCPQPTSVCRESRASPTRSPGGRPWPGQGPTRVARGCPGGPFWGSGRAHFRGVWPGPPIFGGGKAVPTGRVIKYPKKCALFGPAGRPGGPAGPPRFGGVWPGGPFWGVWGPVWGGPFWGGPGRGSPHPIPPNPYIYAIYMPREGQGPIWGSGRGARFGGFLGVRTGGPPGGRFWAILGGPAGGPILGHFWGSPGGGRPRAARPAPRARPRPGARPAGRGPGRAGGWWRGKGGPGPVRPPPDPRST